MIFSADNTGKLVGICSSLFSPHDDLVKIKMFHYNQETLKQAREKEAERKGGKNEELAKCCSGGLTYTERCVVCQWVTVWGV